MCAINLVIKRRQCSELFCTGSFSTTRAPAKAPVAANWPVQQECFCGVRLKPSLPVLGSAWFYLWSLSCSYLGSLSFAFTLSSSSWDRVYLQNIRNKTENPSKDALDKTGALFFRRDFTIFYHFYHFLPFFLWISAPNHPGKGLDPPKIKQMPLWTWKILL